MSLFANPSENEVHTRWIVKHGTHLIQICFESIILHSIRKLPEIFRPDDAFRKTGVDLEHIFMYNSILKSPSF